MTTRSSSTAVCIPKLVVYDKISAAVARIIQPIKQKSCPARLSFGTRLLQQDRFSYE